MIKQNEIWDALKNTIGALKLEMRSIRLYIRQIQNMKISIFVLLSQKQDFFNFVTYNKFIN